MVSYCCESHRAWVRVPHHHRRKRDQRWDNLEDCPIMKDKSMIWEKSERGEQKEGGDVKADVP